MDWLNIQVANEMVQERIAKAEQQAQFEARMEDWSAASQPESVQLGTLFSKLREALRPQRSATRTTNRQTV